MSRIKLILILIRITTKTTRILEKKTNKSLKNPSKKRKKNKGFS